MKATDYINQRYDADREVRSFLSKYEARADLSRDMQYYRRQPIQYRDWLSDGAPMPFHQEVEREPMVEVNLPQHQFRRLVEREGEYQDMINRNQHLFDMINDQRAEERVRRENPAVEQAWQRYRLLLEIARK